MQLTMYLGNDLIEAIPLSLEKIPVPGYLGQIKRSLKNKYASLIEETSARPEFLVVDLMPVGRVEN